MNVNIKCSLISGNNNVTVLHKEVMRPSLHCWDNPNRSQRIPRALIQHKAKSHASASAKKDSGFLQEFSADSYTKQSVILRNVQLLTS